MPTSRSTARGAVSRRPARRPASADVLVTTPASLPPGPPTPPGPPPELVSEMQLITPSYAASLLGALDPRQRPVSKGHIARLASDMRAGRFAPNPDPIVVTDAGLLVNGQHRLRAVIEADVSVYMMVSYGWGPEVYDVMDAGMRRALAHRVTQDWLRYRNGIPTVRATIEGGTAGQGHRVSEQTLLAFAIEQEPVFLALFDLPGAKSLRAPVAAVVARALMHGEPTDELGRFVRIVTSGMAEGPLDGAATRLFAHLADPATRRQSGSVAACDLFKRTQAALRAFRERRPVAKLYAIEADLWPLPPSAALGTDA
jgi:hypothetical protein